ncbi:RNA-directed DNA polymerase [Bradyrhizobium paxllaeri]|uniref:RNA-directed DNA polymerase n=1 Tax=Bradyrhizobium paxllaeri TaxID=190148 RepID=UPI000AA74B1D|nr:RNA-directed DNA polymerase [Bradyrhizobium paxllaeri]
MQHLEPKLNLLSQEYVLVQAWKKTSAYIRYHNWFADTLELDRTAADLPRFIRRLARRLRTGRYELGELSIVPAPKSHPWSISKDGKWRPLNRRQVKIRPLAQVPLADQVVATAILLCLSERVETTQGNPVVDVREPSQRTVVSSYGNRLFCDFDPNRKSLVHRWGSTKLYRAYFQDYRTFLTRSEIVAAESAGSMRAFVFQTDLKQFYDRVRPALLQNKFDDILLADDDPGFRKLVSDFFKWQWRSGSDQRAEEYASAVGLSDYTEVALPQGLVSAGFFSNIVLVDFDAKLRDNFGSEVISGIWLNDACRYVDDLRLTITLSPGVDPADVQLSLFNWVGRLLNEEAPGLLLEPDKTKIAEFGGEDNRLVRQSRKMERIQAAISGGFDAAGGEEVIQAIEALVRSQVALNHSSDAGRPNALKALSDVRDETIGRFAAVRFRTTYRSLRPLLDDRSLAESSDLGEETFRLQRLTQGELDDEAKMFSLTLIDRWVADPSNVRLLRVALDLWPSPNILKEILGLLVPYLQRRQGQGSSREIALYCLAEVLRAGATETGFVEDDESFPNGVDLAEYRSLLLEVAARIDIAPLGTIPWFLRQQALLYLAAHNPRRARLPRRRTAENRYRRMLRFLAGQHDQFKNADYAILAIVSRRSFLSLGKALELILPSINDRRFAEIAARDIELARDIYRARNIFVSPDSGIAEDLGVAQFSSAQGMTPLREIVAGDPLNLLRNEIGVLSFALAFIREVRRGQVPAIATPSTVQVSLEEDGKYAFVSRLAFRPIEVSSTYRSIYTPPEWATEGQEWRFQLGYLLRYILTARIDFTLPANSASWKEEASIYRPTQGHWYQRQYGFFNGHEAFGDDWLPISQFTQDFLFSLLRWPGCRAGGVDGDTLPIDAVESKVAGELDRAREQIGKATGILMLPVAAPIPGVRAGGRPLRGCVVQSVTPDDADFSKFGPEMSDPAIRKEHRNHLSSALAAVEKMLDLRDTHKNQNKRLDWLILPELSVHPRDVRTHLVPFARAFKTTILAGLTYEQVFSGGLLVNSAVWIIPRMVPGQGLQTIVRRQGKQNLSPMEAPFNNPVSTIMGFRPCQWLVGYEWSSNSDASPLWLTGAICYDATDLELASDLRSRSDVFAIPALNRDVGTFDQMAQALHYHMYQLVIVANNGTFGGSNAHLPKGGPYQRQVFHTHGQPQASISFFEIDDIAEMKERRQHGLDGKGQWKYPPAGY